MITEFDRYEVERCINTYSNDLLRAFHAPTEADESTKKNAIARAQSVLSDWSYLQKVIDGLAEQIKESQRRL